MTSSDTISGGLILEFIYYLPIHFVYGYRGYYSLLM